MPSDDAEEGSTKPRTGSKMPAAAWIASTIGLSSRAAATKKGKTKVGDLSKTKQKFFLFVCLY